MRGARLGRETCGGNGAGGGAAAEGEQGGLGADFHTGRTRRSLEPLPSGVAGLEEGWELGEGGGG